VLLLLPNVKSAEHISRPHLLLLVPATHYESCCCFCQAVAAASRHATTPTLLLRWQVPGGPEELSVEAEHLGAQHKLAQLCLHEPDLSRHVCVGREWVLRHRISIHPACQPASLVETRDEEDFGLAGETAANIQIAGCNCM
jgi:hypothetical protein